MLMYIIFFYTYSSFKFFFPLYNIITTPVMPIHKDICAYEKVRREVHKVLPSPTLKNISPLLLFFFWIFKPSLWFREKKKFTTLFFLSWTKIAGRYLIMRIVLIGIFMSPSSLVMDPASRDVNILATIIIAWQLIACKLREKKYIIIYISTCLLYRININSIKFYICIEILL
jgi:hypothetical protein